MPINIRVLKNCLLMLGLHVVVSAQAEVTSHARLLSEYMVVSKAAMPDATDAMISAQQAAQAASQSTGGKVLAVRLSGNSYRVKVLIGDGVVRIVYVDARSGQVSG